MSEEDLTTTEDAIDLDFEEAGGSLPQISSKILSKTVFC